MWNDSKNDINLQDYLIKYPEQQKERVQWF